LFEPIFLSHCFPEFRPHRCKFRECSHISEPECGILLALAEGKISQERYRSYLGLLKGKSFREGDGFESQASEIADLKAREQHRDENAASTVNTDSQNKVMRGGQADEDAVYIQIHKDEEAKSNKA
jgi:hypothetical protein